jgi:hypothetical protein
MVESYPLLRLSFFIPRLFITDLESGRLQAAIYNATREQQFEELQGQ